MVIEEAWRIDGGRRRDDISGRSPLWFAISSPFGDGDLHAHRTDVVQWAKALVAAPFTEKVAAELIDLVRFAEPDQAQMAGWALGFGEVPAGLRSEVVSALLEVPVDTTRPGAVRGQAAESG